MISSLLASLLLATLTAKTQDTGSSAAALTCSDLPYSLGCQAGVGFGRRSLLSLKELAIAYTGTASSVLIETRSAGSKGLLEQQWESVQPGQVIWVDEFRHRGLRVGLTQGGGGGSSMVWSDVVSTTNAKDVDVLLYGGRFGHAELQVVGFRLRNGMEHTEYCEPSTLPKCSGSATAAPPTRPAAAAAAAEEATTYTTPATFVGQGDQVPGAACFAWSSSTIQGPVMWSGPAGEGGYLSCATLCDKDAGCAAFSYRTSVLGQGAWFCFGYAAESNVMMVSTGVAAEVSGHCGPNYDTTTTTTTTTPTRTTITVTPTTTTTTATTATSHTSVTATTTSVSSTTLSTTSMSVTSTSATTTTDTDTTSTTATSTTATSTTNTDTTTSATSTTISSTSATSTSATSTTTQTETTTSETSTTISTTSTSKTVTTATLSTTTTSETATSISSTTATDTSTSATSTTSATETSTTATVSTSTVTSATSTSASSTTATESSTTTTSTGTTTTTTTKTDTTSTTTTVYRPQACNGMVESQLCGSVVAATMCSSVIVKNLCPAMCDVCTTSTATSTSTTTTATTTTTDTTTITTTTTTSESTTTTTTTSTISETSVTVSSTTSETTATITSTSITTVTTTTVTSKTSSTTSASSTTTTTTGTTTTSTTTTTTTTATTTTVTSTTVAAGISVANIGMEPVDDKCTKIKKGRVCKNKGCTWNNKRGICKKTKVVLTTAVAVTTIVPSTSSSASSTPSSSSSSASSSPSTSPSATSSTATVDLLDRCTGHIKAKACRADGCQWARRDGGFCKSSGRSEDEGTDVNVDKQEVGLPTAAPTFTTTTRRNRIPATVAVHEVEQQQYSDAICNQLQWRPSAIFQESHAEAGTTPLVCGATAQLGECKAAATWSEALETCSAAGARLCTASELQQDAAQGTGCMFDYAHIWTSDTCGGDQQQGAGAAATQFHVLAGGSTKVPGSICVEASAAPGAVRCCADAISPLARVDYADVKEWMEQKAPLSEAVTSTPEPQRRLRRDDEEAPNTRPITDTPYQAHAFTIVVMVIGGIFVLVLASVMISSKWTTETQNANATASLHYSSSGDKNIDGASAASPAALNAGTTHSEESNVDSSAAAAKHRRRSSAIINRTYTNGLEGGKADENEIIVKAELSLMTALRTGGSFSVKGMSTKEIAELLQFGILMEAADVDCDEVVAGTADLSINDDGVATNNAVKGFKIAEL